MWDQTYSYFYNSSGLIARIERQVLEESPDSSYVLELIYESGTTPSIQYHHGQLITLRGEVAPLVGILGYLSRSIEGDTDWLEGG